MYQHKTNPVEHSEQEIANESFNDTYKIAIQGNYGYDSVSDSFLPLAANQSWDYMSSDYSGSTADVYKFYQGGSGGTLVSTTTVNWTDSTKTVLSNVTRT